MPSAAAPRPGSTPDHPARPVIATPAAEPDGPVSVGSLLRREGRRAAHALDRPLVPRARDLAGGDGWAATHGITVAAGAVLAVTAVLGTNAVGDPAILSGIGVDDAADSQPAAAPAPVPAPAPAPAAPADTEVSVGQAVAALQEAGGPVRAVLADRLTDGLSDAGGAAVSGAGIVAAVLGGSPGSADDSVAAGSDDADDREAADQDAETTDDDSGSDGDDRSSPDRNGGSGDSDADPGSASDDSDDRGTDQDDDSDNSDDSDDSDDDGPGRAPSAEQPDEPEPDDAEPDDAAPDDSRPDRPDDQGAEAPDGGAEPTGSGSGDTDGDRDADGGATEGDADADADGGEGAAAESTDTSGDAGSA